MLEVSIVEVTANHNDRIEKDCWKVERAETIKILIDKKSLKRKRKKDAKRNSNVKKIKFKARISLK